jgi:hydrogenase-4 component B
MTILLFLALSLPLLLSLMALHRRSRPRLIKTLPGAALPALLLAVLGGETFITYLPYGLTGVLLGLDGLRRMFLMLAALLWLAAGGYAILYLKSDARAWRFALFWLLTLAGNLGLIVSFDVVTFYSFFALMTFAGYGLVVHSGSAEAYRAGRMYLIMAVIGEGLLLAGLLSAVFVAGTNPILSGLPAAIASSEQSVLISVLILLGFGVKAGLPLLHIWLPLAHPVAPTPASAVLSGVMIKAGLLGWLLILPLGEISLPILGGTVIAMGLLASYGGALVGVCQHSPKAVLAYSSISQMGLMTLIVGLIIADTSLALPLMPVAALFAVHHGLAKGALFLSVSTSGSSVFYQLATILPALSLIGLPFTSGASAKLAVKAGLPGPDSGLAGVELLPLALSLAAIATTLLMVRFFWCLRRQPHSGSPGRVLEGWWLLMVFFSGGLFWWLPHPVAEPLQIGITLGDAWDLVLPVVIAGVLVIISTRLASRMPLVPAGDVLVPINRFLAWSYRHLSRRGETTRLGVSLRIVAAGDWYRRKVIERVAPEKLEKALRRHGAWVFLLFTGVLVLLMQLAT